ncbi:right-handed parallel beta-helix repeat-containing protein [Mucilaginibacter sp. OK098]|uniref:right-handed parallel beta-helix repeat-containing protein n=1 Tax=Mucilaginibacter sp. OK098 TaxID=1855297 RepID=UPI00091CCF84|nr:right-handed parallel beta-helix repeat-containing protein [Mucilaginibacter sp. OK098]SHM04320.1 Right handed beta helix region [Mucilaginibacter sp. OK098]
MKLIKSLPLVLLVILNLQLKAQTLYVDAIKGHDESKGTIADPLASLQKAVSIANGFTGPQPVTIKLAPGLYRLTDKLHIESPNGMADTSKFTIEATVMPDDTAWQPGKMPVIQSIADTNSGKKFKYCVGIQIARNNVSIKALKFLGNPNPGVEYYYCIERQNEKLKGLEISQCYFIGERNSAAIQGALFGQGADINIDHCIFYNCKNAVLVFLGLKNFSLTHSIIYGAYEAAIWYGYGESSNAPFTFSNNIIANGNYFWVSDKEHTHHYTFSNSLITNNKYFMGLNGMEIEGPDIKNTPIEVNISKTGNVLLNEVTAKGIPHNYLNLSPESAGNELHAGIFKNK